MTQLLVSEMERDRERHQVERNTDRLKEMLKCQRQADMPGLHCGARWRDGDERASHWLQKPRAELTGGDAAGGPRGRQTDWDGGGVSVCLYLCMCVWELLSLFNRHCKRKHKIYSNTTKIKGIVNSRINILPLFTHFHVILNLSVGHKKRIFHEKFICFVLIILPFKLLTVRTSVSQWLRELNSRTESINKMIL